MKKISFLLMLVIFISCSNSSNSSDNRNTIVFVGDSITHGHNGYNFFWKDSFVDYECINLAIPGAGSDYLTWIVYNVIECNPKIISVMIGINDLGYYNREIPKIIQNIEYFLNCILSSVENIEKIYINSVLPLASSVSVLDYKKNTNNIQINELNLELQELSKKYDCVFFVDVYNSFLKSDSLDSLFLDGLHPNKSGYEIWIKKLKEKIEEN